MSTFRYERPESIGRFLGMTEGPQNHLLIRRVEGRQQIAERRGGSLTPISALAYLFLENGSQYLKGVSNNLPSGTPHIHPYEMGGFQKLHSDEQKNVKSALIAVIVGASVLSFNDMMQKDMGLFDRKYFIELYNSHLTGTGLPTVTLDDMPVGRNGKINEDGKEIINEWSWVCLRERYKESGFADFLDASMWDKLPLSLAEFMRRQGWNLATEVQKLSGEFATRAKLLIKHEDEVRAAEATAFRQSASMFFEGALDFPLDPSQPSQRLNLPDGDGSK